MTGEWTSVHDLALVFLACMHGGDAIFDDVEKESGLFLLASRFPNLTDKELSRILDEALLTYLGTAGEQLLSASIYSLNDELSRQERLDILKDLTSIASADGLLYPAEVDFIALVAQVWGLRRSPSSN